ncbi:hypothetical protein PC111_g7549 [Phytophthora cactorum]|nr:hypothetical protein PC111_g7549 [Phytophthora cactorum]
MALRHKIIRYFKYFCDGVPPPRSQFEASDIGGEAAHERGLRFARKEANFGQYWWDGHQLCDLPTICDRRIWSRSKASLRYPRQAQSRSPMRSCLADG